MRADVAVYSCRRRGSRYVCQRTRVTHPKQQCARLFLGSGRRGSGKCRSRTFLVSVRRGTHFSRGQLSRCRRYARLLVLVIFRAFLYRVSVKLTPLSSSFLFFFKMILLDSRLANEQKLARLVMRNFVSFEQRREELEE